MKQPRIFWPWQLSRRKDHSSHQERGTPLVLVWATQSTPVVCEASHPNWTRRKDFLSMPRCTKKHDRYKEAMRDIFKEEAKQEMKQMLVEIMANLDYEIRQQLASVMSSQQVPTVQPPQMITQTPRMQMVIMQPSDSPMVPSSIESMTNREHYAVDDIVAPIACSLVI
jgi:hypothetical protein